MSLKTSCALFIIEEGPPSSIEARGPVSLTAQLREQALVGVHGAVVRRLVGVDWQGGAMQEHFVSLPGDLLQLVFAKFQ